MKLAYTVRLDGHGGIEYINADTTETTQQDETGEN
jgi:hypothetical protein